MTEGAGAFFEQIRALAARPVEPPSPDPFLQSVLATEQIDRCAQMEELLAQARALGLQAPTDVIEILELASAGKQEAIEVRAAAEDRIARAAAGSKYIIDGIERLEGHSNQSWWKANRIYTAFRNWEPPLNQISRDQLVVLARHMINSAAAAGIEPPEDVLAIVKRIEDGF